MSPEPIIALQRRLSLVGAIRAGGEKQPNKPGRKLESYRLTSPRRELIEQAAKLYGGDVTPWKSPTGDEWQVYTEAEELPVLVMPGYSLRQSYELWEGATKRTRMCDGIDEELTSGPCICNATGDTVCDIYTRLVVALPELETVLGWRLITKGANAAHELPGIMALIEARAGGATFVPARLRIDERRGVKDGQVVRFVVPLLDLNASYAMLAAGEDVNSPRALPAASYTPAPDRAPTVDEALSSVAGVPPAGTERGAAPLGPRHAVERGAPTPMPIEDDAPAQGSYSERRQTLYATDPQKAKLNVLVGQLRTGGHITTEGLYLAVSQRLRNLDAGIVIEEVGGKDEDGVLHWAPLREALLRPEANQLIDWLEAKAQKVAAVEGVTTPASESAFQPPADVQQVLDSRPDLDEHGFPKGY
jgi:hypothetical protein